jgi:asparagine synthase (glutamine-hydrolysing)
MCGICGVYERPPADRAMLERATARMAAALRHRGPDDEGVWTDAAGRIGLGNRRLAIIDPSPAGHQPMADPTGRVVLTYNGMIYNFRELRRDLEQRGYPFRGHSDTEVVLALYLRDGADMVRNLRGMFALAVWDGRSQSLLLARDRLGIKPLYYSETAGRWVFASEIRALRASGLVPVRVNDAALAAFLRLGSVPAPMTVLDGVHELPPATMLTVDASGCGLPRRYWEIPAPADPARSDGDIVAELRARFDDSVRRHLISDVPFGVFLSGGVDSGAIAATMREAGHARIRSFSITFPEWEHDEGPDAARLAQRYGTEHTAYEVRGATVAGELDRVVASMDQPTVDGLNTYYVSRITRTSGTIVALSGLGGDELFCGYPSFNQTPRLLAWQRAAARLGPARPALVSALAALPASPPPKVREGLAGAATLQTAYVAVRGLFGRNELSGLLRSGPLRESALALDAAAAAAALVPTLPDDPVAATGILELRAYMHNQLLRDTDVMSMAHSLEVRVPFLDHPLVEFAAGLPGRIRANGHPPKWLLRRALGDRLPPDTGRVKRGFTFPMAQWLRGPLRPRVDDALEAGASLFHADAVRALQARVEDGRAHWSRLWAIVVLCLWLRTAAFRPETA